MEMIWPRTRFATAGRPVYHERRDMDQDGFMKVINEFKQARGKAFMHAIAGGRVSEGIDFPGTEMELAIIAGVPYPKPTAKHRAFQHFCELKFGSGWEIAVEAPTTRKLQQAIGRLIRSETDRGVAVILDKRAVHFLESLSAKKTSDPVSDANEFFSSPQKAPGLLTAAAPRRRKGLEL